MSKEQLYDIMCIDEDGYAIAHQRGCSSEYAEKEMNRLKGLYPNITYYLSVSVVEEEEEERHYNERAVDGWEDMFPRY
jgi:hypothetical protein